MFLLPSRGRPENFERFIKCCHDTRAIMPITLLLDECDHALGDYLAIRVPENFAVKVSPRAKPARKMNDFFWQNRAIDWVGILADDLIPMTVFWDQILVERAGKRKIAYPNDLFQRDSLCTHPVIGGDILRSLGWLIHPDLKHYYGDTVLYVVGQAINGLEYCEDVVLKHDHHLVTGNKDSTALDLGQSYEEDEAVYTAWIKDPETKKMLIKMRLAYAG